MVISTFKSILIVAWLFVSFSKPVNSGEIIPCFVKLDFTSDVGAVVNYSGIDNIMLLSENFGYFAASLDAENSLWIKFRKFCEDCSSKFFSSIIKPIFFISEQDESMSGNYSEKDNNSPDRPRDVFAEDIVHWILLAFLALFNIYVAGGGLNKSKTNAVFELPAPFSK